ncbi:cell wall invertase 4 [Wolffia australiana]
MGRDLLAVVAVVVAVVVVGDGGGFGERGVEGSHVVYPEAQGYEAAKVSDRHRTGFHFQPPANWINGPMLYKGVYHLFYQYNPRGAVWGNIVWAHAVSTDLINWKILDPAITPSEPFDINGCWSGSATLLPSGKPAILYTGVDQRNRQVQNIAFPKNLSDPFLRYWEKPRYNPVIVPRDGVNATAFRDPTTAWLSEDGFWNVLVGSRRRRRGLAVLYRSADLVQWVKAKHPLHSSPRTGMWECPDFFPVSVTTTNGLDFSSSYELSERKYVLKVSLDETRFEYYTVGRYLQEKGRYVPDGTSEDGRTGLRYDYGNFYASKTFYDGEKRRRVLWGWSNESDSRGSDVGKGWAGVQAIPRRVWLDEGGEQVVQWPVEEVERLRGKRVEARGVELADGKFFEVHGVRASQTDVEVTFEVKGLEKAEPLDGRWTDAEELCGRKGADVGGGVGPFGMWVLASGDRTERTAVFFRVFRAAHDKHHVLMCHDIRRSTAADGVWKPSFGGWVNIDIKKNKKISLRTLIDGSVVESFGAGGKTCITSRVYPEIALGDSAHLYTFNNGETAVEITQLHAWEMKSATIY